MFILICTIDGQEYAFDLKKIDNCILASETTPFPGAPEFFLGALNFHGQIIPVVNTRKLLGLPQREIEVKDHFILCHMQEKQLALWVDTVKRVKLCGEGELIPPNPMVHDVESVQYALEENGQIILLYDLDKLLSSNTLLASTL